MKAHRSAWRGVSRPLDRSLSRGFTRCLLSLTFALACMAALLAGTAPVWAQDASTGTVTGRVLDSGSGNYLEGAEITVEGTTLKAVTERGGGFTLRGVPAGAQTLVTTYPGLEIKASTVAVTAGATVDAAITLKSDVVQLAAYTVSGAREGMAQAVALQKISVQAKMVAAADQFGEISEGNVGEYMKFMPGVSIDYNVNDARGISLRGLSTAFTIVSVDGTPMAGASSVDDTRRFEFEQIAMNNVETTELFKTVTPDIPASATGGYVNFVTKSAFDHEEVQRITYNVSFSGPSTNLSLGKQSGVWGHDAEYTVRPSLDFNFSRKFSDRVGLNLSYRFSEKYDDSPRTEFTWVTATTAPTVMTAPRLQQYNIRDEQKLTHREALAGKLDFIISPKTKLALTGQWNWYDLNFTQRGPQFVLGTGATGSGGTYTSGASGVNINNGTLYREKYGTTWHFNGTLSHEFDNGGKLEVTPYWSRADGQYRDTSKGFISAVAQMAPGAANYSSFTLANVTNLGVLPTITLTQGATPVPLDFIRSLGNYRYTNSATGGNLQSRPWTAIDEKNGARADYSYDLDLAVPVKLTVGAALDNTDRSIMRPDYRGAVTAITGAALTALADPGYTGDVALGFGTFQSFDPYKVLAAYGSNLTTLQVDDARWFNEKNTAGYARADVQVNKDLLLVGGLRWEKRTIDARAQSRASTRSKLAKVDLGYDELYPSASFKYTPQRDIVVRGGISRTVGHPDYSDLLPIIDSESTLGAANGSITVPDPKLKPYFSNNFDLSLDYYLKNSGVVGVYLFRKDVKNYFISRGMTAAERNAIATDYGYNPAEFSTGTVRENGGKSTLQGLELSYAQNLAFMPKALGTFNVQANFTYVDITAKDPDPLRQLDTEYSQLRAVSPKTFNFILGYRYQKFSSTLTANWVDESLYGGFVGTAFVTGSANPTNQLLDTRLTLNKDEKTTIDIKFEYAFDKRFSLYFLVRNVTNSARKEFLRGYLPQYQSVVLPMRYFEFGEPHLTLGLKGSF
ncbi:MAG: TonB-dependent receptor [Opitutaceae bacterium]|nr:TonB-dependent receptor [Opitutaceae bacterium]MBP9912202.1 TonB-dependent receptor [Opitutaceae bacterium]